MGNLFVGGPYQQVNGTAITATSTKVNGGSIKMAGASDLARTVAPSVGDYANSRLVAGCDFGQADWGSFVTVTGNNGVATGITNGSSEYAGLAKLTKLNHGLIVGDVINVANNATGVNDIGVYEGPHRVVAVVDSSNVVLNTPYVSAQTGITYASPVGTAGSLTAGNYSMRGVESTVHGQADSHMSTPASDYGRNKLHQVNAVRTQKVATAIRAGDWVEVSGQFINKPATSNDLATMGTDEVTQDNSTKFGLKGEFTYRYGGPSGVSDDYDGKTD